MYSGVCTAALSVNGFADWKVNRHFAFHTHDVRHRIRVESWTEGL